jgi:hypothetical protein
MAYPSTQRKPFALRVLAKFASVTRVNAGEIPLQHSRETLVAMETGGSRERDAGRVSFATLLCPSKKSREYFRCSNDRGTSFDSGINSLYALSTTFPNTCNKNVQL